MLFDLHYEQLEDGESVVSDMGGIGGLLLSLFFVVVDVVHSRLCVRYDDVTSLTVVSTPTKVRRAMTGQRQSGVGRAPKPEQRSCSKSSPSPEHPCSNHNDVRVPRACGHQSILAQSDIRKTGQFYVKRDPLRQCMVPQTTR